MRIAIIGANGQLGRRLVNEAQARGHAVTACSRARGGVVQVVVDAVDTESIAAVAHDHDAVIACTRPPHDADEQTEWVLRTSQGLLDGCAAASTPLLLVGGSGSLKSPNRPGLLAVDDPKIVPDQWRPIARACLAQWELCRNHPWQGWTHACPPAQLAPGRRTGDYIRGRDTVLVAPDGTSAISMEDFAVAILDEVEQPRATGDRFTVVAAAAEQASAQNASVEENAGLPTESGVDR